MYLKRMTIYLISSRAYFIRYTYFPRTVQNILDTSLRGHLKSNQQGDSFIIGYSLLFQQASHKPLTHKRLHSPPNPSTNPSANKQTNKQPTTKYVNHVHVILFILFHIGHLGHLGHLGHPPQLNLQPHRHPNIPYPFVGYSNHSSTRHHSPHICPICHHSPPSVQKAQAQWCRHDHLLHQSRRCPSRT